VSKLRITRVRVRVRVRVRARAKVRVRARAGNSAFSGPLFSAQRTEGTSLASV